jgi:type II secretory pathway pseudopilin PulG
MTSSHNTVRPAHRRGWTLIEMLIVCTTVGILTVTGVVTIGMLMSAENRGAESLVRQTTISRLSAQFRADLHATANASLQDGNAAGQSSLVLEHPDGSMITYEIMEDALERRVAGRGDGGHRERFRLPQTQMHFESAVDGRIMRLVLEPPAPLISETAAGDLPQPATQRIAIDAAIAWNLRHGVPEQTDGDTGE